MNVGGTDGLSATETPGTVFTRRVITTVLGLITGLTFTFSFGNIRSLGAELGAPVWVAPLVGPAVDLSVVGLLVGIRHLSALGVPARDLRPARILLGCCGLATLALNVAGPVAAGAYGRAAFDSVGPVLLIGWAEIGPGLLLHLYARTSYTAPALALPSGESVAVMAASPGETRSDARGGSASTTTKLSRTPDRPRRLHSANGRPVPTAELLERARHIDRMHRARRGRPVSADTLRQELRVGSALVRTLVARVRAQDITAAQTATSMANKAAADAV
jgi:hypothetical protein